MPPPGTIPSRESSRDTSWKEPDEMQQSTTMYWSIWCHGLDTNVSTWGPTMALFVRGRIIEFPSLYALNWRSVVFIRRYCSLLSVGCHSFSISARWRKSQITPWSGDWNTADVEILVLLYSRTFLDCTHNQKEVWSRYKGTSCTIPRQRQEA